MQETKKNKINLQNKYIIAAIKPWNIEKAKRRIYNSPKGRVVLLTHKNSLIYRKIKKFKPRYIFFLHWSWRIPGSIYENFECIGFHMTDLPFGRGGTPLQNLIERGVKNTKISAIKIARSLDAGPVYLKRNLSLTGSAEDIYKRASSIIFDNMIPHILKKKPLLRTQKGKVVVFKRRKPEASRIPSDTDLDGVYDHIRMLDCPGYPPAFIEAGNLRFEFKGASKKNKYVYAKVHIVRKG